MLKEAELTELKETLELCKNPLFLFDNDPDGFCSAIILMRAISKGTAYPIKSFPDIDKNLIEKIKEVSPDYLIILDKPFANLEILKEMKELNIETLIIDHHEMEITKELLSLAKVYNSFPSSEPTSFLVQKIFNRKNEEWISMVGCIHDVFKPDFSKSFEEKYPELFNDSLSAFEALHNSEVGKLTKMISLSLKTSYVTLQSMIELFLKINSPNDILLETEENAFIYRRYNFLNKILEKNAKKAQVYPKFVLVEYSGDYSLSSDLANKVFSEHPDKFVVVCFKKYEWVNISVRGKNAKKFTEKVVSTIPRSTGGGHDVACGLRIPGESFNEFKKMIFKKFGKESLKS